MGRSNMNNLDESIAAASEVVNTAVEQKHARRVRFFLQDNFGILYSCVGRGLYFCLVGGLALGEGIIFMEVIGYSFMLMGVWMISLRFRYPSLDKAFVMDFSLDDEFGENRNGGVGSSRGSLYDNEDQDSAVTWSSVSATNVDLPGERKSLMAHTML